MGHAYCPLTDFCERCGLSRVAVEDHLTTCYGDEKLVPVVTRIARRRVLEHVEKRFGLNVTLDTGNYLRRFRAKLRRLGDSRYGRTGVEVRLLVRSVIESLESEQKRLGRLVQLAEHRLRAEIGGPLYGKGIPTLMDEAGLSPSLRLDPVYNRPDPVYSPGPTATQSPPEPESK